MAHLTNEEILAEYSDDEIKALVAEKKSAGAALNAAYASLERAQARADQADARINRWCNALRADICEKFVPSGEKAGKAPYNEGDEYSICQSCENVLGDHAHPVREEAGFR